MEIKTPKQLEIENIAGDFETTKASIDEGSKAFLFEMMSKSLYSNPIGSICREITSNCFDSHREANSDKAVIISKLDDEEGDYISFKDFGVGLSPDRMKNIYMNYFSSTKRHTNDQIGGFGLGSKTPLSYNDYFYIISIYNGIKYDYLFSKGSDVPTLDLLNSEETTLPNGAEIKVYFKEDGDEQEFENNLKEQLCYFDNVFFKGWENIENEYKIYETDSYKYRDTDQYSETMHIILGKVPYPIDWNQISVDPIDAAVGVKFEIGELVVTPNRESLRYTQEVKELVKERVLKVKQELIDKFNEQNIPLVDFRKWNDVRKSRPYIKFGEVDKLYLNNFTDLEKKYKFSAFENIEWYYNHYNIFDYLYEVKKEIRLGKDQKYTYNNPTSSYLNYTKICITNDLNYSTIKSAHFQNGNILKRKLDKRAFRECISSLCLIDLDEDSDRPSKPKFGTKGFYFQLGSAKRVYEINKKLFSIFESSSVDYHKVSEDFITQYRKEQKDNNLSLQRKLNNKVLVRDIIINDKYEWNIYDPKRVNFKKFSNKNKTSLLAIENYSGIVIYGGIEHKKKLEEAEEFFLGFTRFHRRKLKKNINGKKYFEIDNNYLSNKAIKIISISKQNEKHFNKDTMTHIDNLFSDNEFLRKRASCYKIEDLFKKIMKSQSSYKFKDYIDRISEICTGAGETMKSLLVYIEKNDYNYKDRSSTDRELVEKIKDIAEVNNWYDPNIELDIKKVEDWFKGIEILKFLDINEDSLPYILKFLKEKGKKINTEYYLKYTIEKDLEDNIEKDGQIIMLFDEQQEQEIKSKFKVLTEKIA